AEKPRNVRHGLVPRCQAFELASLRGMHNGDAKSSCQVTRSLPEVVSEARVVVRILMRRHGVLVQRELELASAQRSGNTLNGGTFHDRETQALFRSGEGGPSAAPSPGEEAGVRPV